MNAIAESRRATVRRRLVAAAGVGPEALSPQARCVREWLAEWDEPTTEGLVELLGAVRTAAQVTDLHRSEAALAREDSWGAAR